MSGEWTETKDVQEICRVCGEKRVTIRQTGVWSPNPSDRERNNYKITKRRALSGTVVQMGRSPIFVCEEHSGHGVMERVVAATRRWEKKLQKNKHALQVIQQKIDSLEKTLKEKRGELWSEQTKIRSILNKYD